MTRFRACKSRSSRRLRMPLDNGAGRFRVPAALAPLMKPARYKGAHGGRGSGKSHFFAGLLVMRLAAEPGLRVVCLREVQRSIGESVKRLIEDKIEEFGLQTLFEVTENEIRGPGGSLAIFRGLQAHAAHNLKSLEGFDVAFVDEAQAVSQRSLDILTPTIRKPGSEIWFAWNPDNEDDPVDVFLRNDPPDGAIVIEVNHDDNPWFPEELRADMERDRRRDPDKAAHIWDGEYRGLSSARVFRNWRVEELQVPENVVWFYGADWGFAEDPTAGVRFCMPDAETLYVSDEVYEVGVPVEATPALLMGLPGASKWPMRADNARPETIDYCRRHGLPRIRAARKGKGSVEHGVSFLQGLDIVISPRCPNVEREFRRYAYKTDKQTGAVLPVIVDANNHAIDAIRYAAEDLHRKGKMVKTELTQERRRGRDYGVSDDDEDETDWKTV